MPSRYTIKVKEFGRGPANTRRFSSLADVQQYVRGRWEGADYIDGPAQWHNDYCTFTLTGAKLSDLGSRGGPHGTDAYWEWNWADLSALAPAPAASAPAPKTATERGLYWELDAPRPPALSATPAPADAPTGSNEPHGPLCAMCGEPFTAHRAASMSTAPPFCTALTSRAGDTYIRGSK